METVFTLPPSMEGPLFITLVNAISSVPTTSASVASNTSTWLPSVLASSLTAYVYEPSAFSRYHTLSVFPGTDPITESANKFSPLVHL